MNTKVMRKFWKACDAQSTTDFEIQRMWRYNECYKEVLENATRKWQTRPFLSESNENISAIWQAMTANDGFRRSVTQATSAYKIMEMVGRFTGEYQWSAECALVCYRASRTMDELPSEEHKILDEFYEIITYTRATVGQLHDVMVFWARLHKYRERHVYYNRVLQSSEVQTAMPQQTSRILENFKYYELWHDLTEEQQKSKIWRNTLNTILNKRAGWTHAARAIMEYGLPKLERPAEPNDATEHINALGQFARDLAE